MSIQMKTILEVLVERDRVSAEAAQALIDDARVLVAAGTADPEEILHDWFGLEPDYIYDLLGANL